MLMLEGNAERMNGLEAEARSVKKVSHELDNGKVSEALMNDGNVSQE